MTRKNLTTLIWLIVLVLVVAAISGVIFPYGAEKPRPTLLTTSAGVEVQGYHSEGWIRNNNDFPVMIKCVYQTGREPDVRWIEPLQPYEQKDINVSARLEFFISSMEGTPLGHIEPWPD